MVVWMGGKQPEESPEGSEGRTEYRQARERITAEMGQLQSHKRTLLWKDKGKSKIWSIMEQQIGNDIKESK